MRDAPETWLDEPRWKRLRQALDDGVGRKEVALRFGVGLHAIYTIVECRTLAEARAALTERSKRSAEEDRRRCR